MKTIEYAILINEFHLQLQLSNKFCWFSIDFWFVLRLINMKNLSLLHHVFCMLCFRRDWFTQSAKSWPATKWKDQQRTTLIWCYSEAQTDCCVHNNGAKETNGCGSEWCFFFLSWIRLLMNDGYVQWRSRCLVFGMENFSVSNWLSVLFCFFFFFSC